MHNKVTV